jgi:hypothetical protein
VWTLRAIGSHRCCCCCCVSVVCSPARPCACAPSLPTTASADGSECGRRLGTATFTTHRPLLVALQARQRGNSRVIAPVTHHASAFTPASNGVDGAASRFDAALQRVRCASLLLLLCGRGRGRRGIWHGGAAVLPGERSHADGGVLQVFASNLDEQMVVIRDMALKYPMVCIESAQSSLCARPIFRSGIMPADAGYQSVREEALGSGRVGVLISGCARSRVAVQIRINVDLLKLLQVGITFADADGNIAKPVSTWQFHFRFNIKCVHVMRQSGGGRNPCLSVSIRVSVSVYPFLSVSVCWSPAYAADVSLQRGHDQPGDARFNLQKCRCLQQLRN